MIDRLPFIDQRLQKIIDLGEPFYRGPNAFSGIPESLEIFCIGPVRGIVRMIFFTGLLPGTARTNIRRLIQHFTMSRSIPLAQLSAVVFPAKFASAITGIHRLGIAKIAVKALNKVYAVIYRIPGRCYEASVPFYFAGYAGRGSAEFSGHMSKGTVLFNHSFNKDPIA